MAETLYGNDRAKIIGTWKLLDYYRRFLRSDKTEAVNPNPHNSWHTPTITKEAARRALDGLIEQAINIKSGLVAEWVGRKYDVNWQLDIFRDMRRLHQWLNHRIVMRGSGFNTREMQRRFAHVEEAWRDE